MCPAVKKDPPVVDLGDELILSVSFLASAGGDTTEMNAELL